MRRTRTLLAALVAAVPLLVARPAPAASDPSSALPTVAVGTLPSPAVPGDSVTVVLSGMWPDGCVPENHATFVTERDGNAFKVTLRFIPFSGGCTAAVTPWRLELPAVTLDAGTYTVALWQERALQEPILLGSGAFQVAVPRNAFWVPGFSTGDGASAIGSTLSAFNASGETAEVSLVEAYDAAGPRPLAAPAATLLPGQAATLDTRDLRAGSPLQMVRVEASPGVALNAALERLSHGESLGRTPIPVFSALLPAGTRAVAGDVTLAAGECGAAVEPRRVNATLFNGGDETATFVVTWPAPSSANPTGVFRQEVRVQARTLVQLNKLTLDLPGLCQGTPAWFTISADQPFLAYLSSVRPDGRPGVLPYEIFPARPAL